MNNAFLPAHLPHMCLARRRGVTVVEGDWLFGMAAGTVLCRNELRESPTPQCVCACFGRIHCLVGAQCVHGAVWVVCNVSLFQERSLVWRMNGGLFVSLEYWLFVVVSTVCCFFFAYLFTAIMQV